MTKEEKDLLFSDLCSRFPYGVKISKTIENFVSSPHSIRSINSNNVIIEDGEFEDGTPDIDVWDIENIKPYLFPLSRITEEQKQELFELCRFCIEEDWDGKKREVYAIAISSRADPAYCFDHNFYMWGVDVRAIDWLVKNHFDYRGLIEKGLAIDATDKNIY